MKGGTGPSARKDVSVMQYPTYERTPNTFWSAIFDFSFSSFVAIPIAKVLYAILFGMLMLLAAPILFLLTITFSRLMLETFVVVFRLREDTAALREMGERAQN